ncbi:TetR family transcriptional regulator C-terminal domain-containing protein [Cryobacterium sp. TMT2-15-1]|uniref:TetR family transcriptional regulator C-terminal domain-containing protein n=1 Tax=Cryobacterium sp. TMT2-15-1 TaxID=1259246 RepID=UPI001F541C5F|nr:TetR family transcriptional regulator C-terminal domain-containing protein [Cryobacterium sp. TMT2-15-1]
MHDYFVQRYAATAADTERVLSEAQRNGLVRTDLDVRHASRLITAVMDGLQQQWLLDGSVDMPAAFDEFLRGYLLPPS